MIFSLAQISELNQLEFKCGEILCFHISHQSSVDWRQLATLLHERFVVDGKSVSIARPASNEYSVFTFWRPMTASEWLRRKLSLARSGSEAIIEELRRHDLKSDDPLTVVAGTPKALLGICVATASKPDVLIYSTQALDFEGSHAVHQKISQRAGDYCGIHISTPSIHGDGSPAARICPKPCQCIELPDLNLP